MVVAQLLPTPEVRGSNPVIGKINIDLYCQLYWKDESKERRGMNGPFKKQQHAQNKCYTEIL